MVRMALSPLWQSLLLKREPGVNPGQSRCCNTPRQSAISQAIGVVHTEKAIDAKELSQKTCHSSTALRLRGFKRGESLPF